MNAQTLRLALSAALIAAASLSGAAQASNLTTLDAVQVRPSADQVTQQTLERASTIRTLAAVQVRPSTEQLAALATEAAGPRVVTLAAVQVRPSAGQRAESIGYRTATTQVTAGRAAATIGALVGEAIVKLPVPQLQPSPVELEALIGAATGL
ncbi:MULTISPECIES: hypothetical protein [Xanthomonas]|uniref:DUF541 domain-containing protein n=1 Tax=Xanthomonas cucurbitae TaxID=56453 RepID=A0A2S7DXH7_9XANT|nr:hypothetical protein [Xanthomonas cucurbitae]PPU78475.1 hypothetical protein XcuCFBP2542_01945 [Xanthomonas cucurbitae]QHG88742.1 hypothetical protein EBN15_19095 [Xanthomonas cucurbitae]WDM67842.1 hypothetical protein K6981_00420 [Xanthomonas cucurbitae]WDM71716.1 hypothetical protein K6978_00415 [Xanthomonas cucurbitae]WDM75333.1 hypothetical protein K6982_18705 [Xanthomonas cucurbitae]